MLIDDRNNAMTQRDHPKMALIVPKIADSTLSFYFPRRSALSVPFDIAHGQSFSVTVWDDTVNARHIGREADDWFSAALGVRCRLVYFPNESTRAVDRTYAKHNEHTAFADAFPFLLISAASLRFLNGKLKAPVPMDRFRPNIVIDGCEAFAEDTWKSIVINAVVFHLVKPCARCIVTTIDQSTGERSEEPLAMLATFRTIRNKVVFGQNLLAENLGTVSIGDPVTILP